MQFMHFKRNKGLFNYLGEMMRVKEEKKVSGFDLNFKIIISSAFVVIIICAFLCSSCESPDGYVLLYGGLDLRDSSEIIKELDSQNVTYKVRDGGKSIFVPLSDRDRLRITLAGKGFLPSSTSGYDLFDKNRKPPGTFQEKVDYKRALEGELARSIRSLEEIDFARVHLVIPDDDEDQTEPSATVVIKLENGNNLKPETLAKITSLITNRVTGMISANVVVLDDRMNLLTTHVPDESSI